MHFDDTTHMNENLQEKNQTSLLRIEGACLDFVWHALLQVSHYCHLFWHQGIVYDVH